VKETISRYQ